jgi:type II secretory pathway pseudopilin PulG
MSFAKSSIGGMTLLEVILAIAVAGFVLTAAVSLLVSVSSIWSERSERNFFVDHVDGVTEFLNATLASSGFEVAADNVDNSDNGSTTGPTGDELPPPGPESQPDYGSGTSSGNSLAHSADYPICWARPPGFANYREPLLNFGMTEAPPILVSPENAPTLGINAFLYFEADEGLSLLWHSILQEKVEDTNDLQRTLVSPLVKKITYIYWDERFETWEEEESPQEGEGEDQYILPRFIKLLFEYEGETKERTLTIPVASKNALIF